MSIAAIIPVAVIALTRLRVRPKYLIATGFALVGWSGFLYATVTTTTADFWSFGTALAVGGSGFGLLFVPVSVAVLTSVPPALGTKASAMLSIFQQFGASLSTALMVTIIDRRAAFHLDHLASEINLLNASVAALQATHASLAALATLVQVQATTLGFADAYILSGIAGFALVPVALFLPTLRAVATPEVRNDA